MGLRYDKDGVRADVLRALRDLGGNATRGEIQGAYLRAHPIERGLGYHVRKGRQERHVDIALRFLVSTGSIDRWAKGLYRLPAADARSSSIAARGPTRWRCRYGQ